MGNRRQVFALLRCSAFAVMAMVLADQPVGAEPPRVVVTTSKTVQVQPDEAMLTFTISSSVEGPDKSVLESLEKKIDEVKKVLQTGPLEKIPIDIRISPATLSSMQTNPANPGVAPVIHGKKAKSVIQVTVREKDFPKLRTLVGRLAEAAVENGGTSGAESQSAQSPLKVQRQMMVAIGRGNAADEPESVDGPTVQWSASTAAQVRRDAIRQAVKDAMADADAASGGKQLTVVQIEVTDKEKPPEKDKPIDLQMNAMRMLTGEPEQPAVPATVKVQVEVRLTCTY